MNTEPSIDAMTIIIDLARQGGISDTAKFYAIGLYECLYAFRFTVMVAWAMASDSGWGFLR